MRRLRPFIQASAHSAYMSAPVSCGGHLRSKSLICHPIITNMMIRQPKIYLELLRRGRGFAGKD